MSFMILDDLGMSAEEFDWHQKEANRQISQRKDNRQISQRKENQCSSSASKRKRVASASSYMTRIKDPQVSTRKGWTRSSLIEAGLPIYMLFEFASGYAIFLTHDMEEIDCDFKSTEKYIKNFSEVFTLIAYHPFESAAEVLCRMKSNAPEELIKFLMLNLPTPVRGKPSYSIAVCHPYLKGYVCGKTGMAVRCGLFFRNIARGLRLNIDKFINSLEPKDLEKAQRDLACSYSRQKCYSTNIGNSMDASSSFFGDAVVVTHKFEGVFIAKGMDRDAICTKNLVPGEAVYGEELVFAQNDDGTEIEYRVWSPFKSQLAAAIMSGLDNICLKPGSRVLYLGDVCGATLSHLSDLVGHNGLIYAVGLSNVFVKMAEKRLNVIPIFERFTKPWDYSLLVGMVDVLFVDAAASRSERVYIAINAAYFLKAGGHFMFSGQADLSSNDEGMFGYLGLAYQSQFKPIERVVLKQLGDYAMVVGGFRVEA